MAVNSFTEPIWSSLTPCLDYSKSAFDQNDSSYTMISGFLVSLMQYHFSKEYYIREGSLKDLIWDPSAEDTKITIIPEYASVSDKEPDKPRITIKRNECKASTAGILRNVEATITTNTGTEPIICGKNCMALIGTHTLLCENVNGGSAEKLAEEVYRLLLFFSPQIEEDLELNYFNVTGIGPIQQREEIKTYVVPVNLTWTRWNKWKNREVTKI